MSELDGTRFRASIVKNRIFYLMLIPVVAYYLIFCYGPMVGIVVAFQNYRPRTGIFGSAWVGLNNFRTLFNTADFFMVFRNTLIISALKIVIGFPAPIILALLLNEVDNRHFKRFAQTVSYMPHFLSWVIVAQLFTVMLSLEGPVNTLAGMLGAQPSQPLIDPRAARAILIVANVWKEIGWGTLIYLAAIAGVEPEQFESALLDGATRFKQILHIILPSILPTIVVMFVLRMGSVMNAGTEDVLMMENSMTYSVLETIDTYVYKTGITGADYSFATAVGLFKSAISLAAVLLTNKFADRLTGSSLL